MIRHTRTSQAALFAAMLAAALVQSGCGSDDKNPASAPQATNTPGQPGTTETIVKIEAGATGKGTAAYGTNPLVIAPGTKVTWMNMDSVAHTATSTTGVWDSGSISPGQNFSRTFDTVGTFPYYCTIHGAQSMSGVIEVSSGSPTPSASPSVTPSASPSPSPSTPIPGRVDVTIDAGAIGKGSLAYGANPRIVPMGTTVRWTNRDTAPHTVTADSGDFDSGSMSTGETFSHTFSTAGDFPYYCSIHGKASMSGMIRVTP